MSYNCLICVFSYKAVNFAFSHCLKANFVTLPSILVNLFMLHGAIFPSASSTSHLTPQHLSFIHLHWAFFMIFLVMRVRWFFWEGYWFITYIFVLTINFSAFKSVHFAG